MPWRARHLEHRLDTDRHRPCRLRGVRQRRRRSISSYASAEQQLLRRGSRGEARRARGRPGRRAPDSVMNPALCGAGKVGDGLVPILSFAMPRAAPRAGACGALGWRLACCSLVVIFSAVALCAVAAAIASPIEIVRTLPLIRTGARRRCWRTVPRSMSFDRGPFRQALEST